MNSLEYHRRELEGRISRFDGECDQAINRITNLKIHARSFLDTMACDRNELKYRFLWCTRQLDEFMYLVTEFNLSVSKFAAEVNDWPKTNTSKDPVLPPTKNGQSETNFISTHNMSQKLQSNTKYGYPAKQSYQANKHSIESSQTKQGLSSIHKTGQENWRESQIVTHQAKQYLKEPNMERGRASRRQNEPHTSTNTSKDLMQFTSVSCSAESFEENNVKALIENVNDEETCEPGLSLPPQSKLDAATVSACIASADAANLWLVTDMKGLSKLTFEMTEYYNEHQASPEDVPEFSCCAYFDEDTMSFFRAIYIRTEGVAEVFLVDTGESRPLTGRLWPLASRFCNIPALAHCCHLADVDLPDDEQLAEQQATFLRKHLWEEYRIELHTEENSTSESQGVYVYVDNRTTLNELLMRTLASSKPQPTEPIDNGLTNEELPERQVQGSRPDLDSIDLDDELKDEFDYGPEHENPLEAVTGYNNRDEMDICKHYAGGPERACFKGARCKKRHVLQHPDGWTLDRVPVVATCRPAPLPAPGTIAKVKVTNVRDVGCFFVQFEPKDEMMTLADLVEDMNRNPANAKPLKMLPALGELVSARFTDGRRYRARVTSCDDQHGTAEVTYIDYGNESTVKLTDLSPLESRWLALPAAAVRCRLAGVTVTTDAAVTDVFSEMVLELALQARVIARSYDELTLELFDLEGFKVSDQLAVMADVPLQPYEVEDDSRRISLHVPA